MWERVRKAWRVIIAVMVRCMILEGLCMSLTTVGESDGELDKGELDKGELGKVRREYALIIKQNDIISKK